MSIEIHVGDTARAITDTLQLNGAALNLTGGTVVLVWKKLEQNVTNRRAATIVSAAAGTVSYQVGADDVTEEGTALLEWECTLPGGVITVPTTAPIELRIVKDQG